VRPKRDAYSAVGGLAAILRSKPFLADPVRDESTGALAAAASEDSHLAAGAVDTGLCEGSVSLRFPRIGRPKASTRRVSAFPRAHSRQGRDADRARPLAPAPGWRAGPD
jgi:hypothetical protein